MKFLVALLFLLGFEVSSFSQTALTPRHLLILRSGIDAVYGSYIFAAENSQNAPAVITVKLLLPKEMNDFFPQEGLTSDDLRLADGGGLILSKEVPPGVTVMGIGFRVPAHFGDGVMTFVPEAGVVNLTVLWPKDSGLDIASPLLKAAPEGASPDPRYGALVNGSDLKPGETFALTVQGAGEGRTRFWGLGAGAFALLLALGGWFGWRSRPSLSEQDQRIAKEAFS